MVSGYVTACFKNVQKGHGLEQIGCPYQVWLCPSAGIGHSDNRGYVDLSMDIHEVRIWWLCHPQTQAGILI